jgi:hypothetical protein
MYVAAKMLLRSRRSRLMTTKTGASTVLNKAREERDDDEDDQSLEPGDVAL